MGADPTASPVTGECSTVELRPHTDKIAEILLSSNLLLVPPHGREPLQVRPHKGSLADFRIACLALSV